jgi:7-keto-8-aminopelargonate synthetase-like enzyme
MTEAEVERAAALCGKAGAWLILDNTYHHFTYGEGRRHHCAAAPHVINIFSFSKASPASGVAVVAGAAVCSLHFQSMCPHILGGSCDTGTVPSHPLPMAASESGSRRLSRAAEQLARVCSRGAVMRAFCRRLA